MTGYGRREMVLKGKMVGVEVRAVNHRFCEVVPRLPKGLAVLEEDLKKLVNRHCERGRIELTVSMDGGTARPRTLALDSKVAKRYHQLLNTLQRELCLEGKIDVGLIAGFRDVFVLTEQSFEEKELKPAITRLTTNALADLNKMRCREGKVLLSDIAMRLRNIRGMLAVIKRRTRHVVQEYFDRMKERLKKLLGESTLENNRLTQELALYADRCDVTEELTRLTSHLAQFETTIKGKGSMGRQLDFLLQEMGREVNTIGSKANDVEISHQVVQLKGELEKIREQVQNIE